MKRHVTTTDTIDVRTGNPRFCGHKCLWADVSTDRCTRFPAHDGPRKLRCVWVRDEYRYERAEQCRKAESKMTPTLEHLFISTHTARIMAGDTPDLAQSAAIAAVHRAGMEDAAEMVENATPDNDDQMIAFAQAANAIRRAAGGEK